MATFADLQGACLVLSTLLVSLGGRSPSVMMLWLYFLTRPRRGSMLRYMEFGIPLAFSGLFVRSGSSPDP